MGPPAGGLFFWLLFVDPAERLRRAAVVASLLAHPGSGAPRPLAHKLSGVVASLLLGQFAQRQVQTINLRLLRSYHDGNRIKGRSFAALEAQRHLKA